MVEFGVSLGRVIKEIQGTKSTQRCEILVHDDRLPKIKSVKQISCRDPASSKAALLFVVTFGWEHRVQKFFKELGCAA